MKKHGSKNKLFHGRSYPENCDMQIPAITLKILAYAPAPFVM